MPACRHGQVRAQVDAQYGCLAEGGLVSVSAIQGFVNFLAGQGMVVEIVREGELRGVLRLPYAGKRTGHPWQATVGLLWDPAQREFAARWDLVLRGQGAGWSQSFVFGAEEVPAGLGAAEYALAGVIRQIQRTRGMGTGPKCLFHVTSSGWAPEKAMPG